jgi:hypothetical protein
MPAAEPTEARGDLPAVAPVAATRRKGSAFLVTAIAAPPAVAPSAPRGRAAAR